MENKQTAVEWFAFQIMDSWNDIQNGKTSIDELIEQAKQMEKEQIIDAHYQGYRNNIGTTEVSEQYYNETFTSIPQGENPSAKGNEQ